MKISEKIKKIIKVVVPIIGGIFISILTWFVNNLFRKDKSQSSSKDKDLKNDIRETKEEVNNTLKEVDDILTKADNIIQDTVELNNTSSTENRLDTLESAGLIKRKK